MAPKLYKAADVCEIVQLQPYVLRSWEKEFPGIGVQKSLDSPRLYRQSDVEQVQRIKQLVFGEGLTVAGARRRLEEMGPPAADDASDVIEVLGADARMRIAHVRDGLRSLLQLLSHGNGGSEYRLTPPSAPARAEARPAPAKGAPARGRAQEASRNRKVLARKRANA